MVAGRHANARVSWQGGPLTLKGRGYSGLRFETERLVARAWTPGDAEAAFAIYGDPEVARFLTGVPEESVESQRDLLTRLVRAYDQLDLGMGSFPLVLKETGALVGAVLLKPLPRTEDTPAWRALRDSDGSAPPPPVHEIEIGWHLGRAHWGNGYATESAARMLDYAFETLGLDEVHAVLYRENAASARVAERLGMTHLGSTDRFYGVVVEHYAIRIDAWLGRRTTA